jgi:hypothetical protein
MDQFKLDSLLEATLGDRMAMDLESGQIISDNYEEGRRNIYPSSRYGSFDHRERDTADFLQASLIANKAQRQYIRYEYAIIIIIVFYLT